MISQAPISQENLQSPASYLHGMEQLRDEIQTAMLAISGNRLSVLEESLWRQQVLCTSLKHLSHTFASENVESPLMDRLRETSLALQNLNRSYLLLVQQASQSNDLLYRLCRGYKDTAPSPAIHSAQQTWSREA
jgi:hypothetical protein